ncbi:MAG: hypothetical protein LAT64_07320 [Phycisphaerales bacterium]|nr:hypothetical protein [Planctomycetota bacterium]MCH8508566.1 hypothetical protein [Phycisphaerales bacterium]
MNDAATTLIVPGRTEPEAAAESGMTGAAISWGLAVLIVGLGLWAGLNGRRRRRTDPRELAFRRLAHASGWNRSQVRALRREAGARGLGSPVGLALSPSLTEAAFARHASRSRGAQSAG